MTEIKFNDVFTEEKYRKAQEYPVSLRRQELTGVFGWGGKPISVGRFDFQGSCLVGAQLEGAKATCVGFGGCDLSKACFDEADLAGSNLQQAELANASFKGANLSRVNLTNARYSFAEFTGAKFSAETRLPNGEAYSQYLKFLRVFLTVGGQTLKTVRESWQCHNWDNCPIAIAFGVNHAGEVPRLYRRAAVEFVDMFDCGMLPESSFEEF